MGGDHLAWRVHEQADHLTYPDVRLDRATAVALPPECLTSLAQEFGDALVCAFYDGEDLLLRVDSTLDAAAMVRFAEDSDGLDEVTLQFRLDKASFAMQRYSAPTGCRVVVYLYPEAFASLLGADARTLEVRLWADEPKKKVVVVLPSETVFADSVALAILGGNQLSRLGDVTPADQEALERLARIHATAVDHLYWRRRWVRFLTPQHFDIAGGGLNSLFGLEVRRHVARLLPFFTADKSVETDEGVMCTYASPDFSVDVSIPELGAIGDLDEACATGIQRVLAWIYEMPMQTKRLSISQLVVARHLHFVDTELRFQRLLEVASELLDELIWTEKMAMSDSLRKYSSEVRSLEDYVDKTVQTFAEQVSTVIKSFTDAVLAGLGAVLLGLLAVLIKEGLGSAVFGVSLIAYGIYVHFFQVSYNLRNHKERADIALSDFQYRCDRFKERIYGQNVDLIVGQRVSNAYTMLTDWMKRAESFSHKVVWVSMLVGSIVLLISLAPIWSPLATSAVTSGQTWLSPGDSASPVPPPVATDDVPTATPTPP